MPTVNSLFYHCQMAPGWAVGGVLLFVSLIGYVWLQESTLVVESVVFQSKEQIWREIQRRQVPFLIEYEGARSSPSLQWSQERLERALEGDERGWMFRNCKNGSSPLFTLRNDAKGPNELSKSSYFLQDTPAAELFHGIWGLTLRYLYHSGPLSDWPKQLQEELPKGLEQFHFHSTDLPDSLGPGKQKYQSVSSMWIGSPGVIANCHYDKSHNVFLQVLGEKRWTLYPPCDALNFYLYPPFHPSYHQGRIGDIHRVDSLKFPLFDRCPRPYSVLLHPGDVLYIPRKFLKSKNSFN